MTVNENSKPLLTVKGLKQYFKVSNNYTEIGRAHV